MVVCSEGWVTVVCGRVLVARFADGDLGMRNLAVVSLTNTRLESKTVAAAFGLSETYVSILRGRVRDEGSAGLVRDRGRPVAIDARGEAVAVSMAANGKTQVQIAVRLGVDRSTVSRLFKRLAGEPVEPEQLVLGDINDDADDVGYDDGFVVAAEGVENTRLDDSDLGESVDVDDHAVVSGVRSCRYAGAMLGWAFMDRVGFADVFKMATPAGYRYLTTTLLAGTTLGLLLGAGNIEGFKHLTRTDLGVLVGIDRFPTVRTLRVRLGDAGDTVNAIDRQTRLAKALLTVDAPAIDLFFIDDHFVTYSGSAPLAKGWNNRRGRAEHGHGDTWATDFHGRPLVCLSGEPAGLTVGLDAIITPLRDVVGDKTRPLLAFDRAGSYPSTFASLDQAGWDWVAYRRAPLAPCTATPKTSWFALDGIRHTYRCADEIIDLDDYGPARQITVFENGEPVAQILTSITAGVTARTIHLLRCRWRIENAFKYLTDNHGIDWLCDYTKTEKTVTIEITNPERVTANLAVADAKTGLTHAKTRLADITTTHVTDVTTHLANLRAARDNIVHAQDNLATAKAHLKTIPAKLHPAVTRAEPRLERRALQTALRICAHNTEHWLARQLDTHLQNPDEVRAITRNLMHQPGSINYQPDRITVTINPPDQPNITRALQHLTNQLNQQPAHLPGDLRPITYTIKPHP